MISALLALVLLLSIFDIISLVNAIQGSITIYLNCIIHYFILIKLGQSYLQGSWSFAQVLRIPEAGSTYGDTPPYLGMSSSILINYYHHNLTFNSWKGLLYRNNWI
jgi:hypothetical protein